MGPGGDGGHSSSRGSRSLRFGLTTSTDAGGSYEDVGGSFGAFSFALRFGSLRGRSRPFAIARTSCFGPAKLRRSCAAGPYQPVTRRLLAPTARFYASLRDSSAVASCHSTPVSYDVIRAPHPNDRRRARSRLRPAPGGHRTSCQRARPA